jgi:hypothetical protein
MAYIVNKTNSSASPNQFVVSDGTVNNQTDLRLVGKGYSGYGEVIAENFLHLLENFSNTTAPTKPVKGQLWFDETSGKLKVYAGTSFQPAGGATYQNTEPSQATAGDLWVKESTQQLYFNNGVEHVLVGPASTTASGLFFNDIKKASDDSDVQLQQLKDNATTIAVFSKEDNYQPKTSIAGFHTIYKGITINRPGTEYVPGTSLPKSSTYKFYGTATNADSVGNYQASDFILKPAGVTLDTTGLTVGGQNNFKFTSQATYEGVISNIENNKDIIFKITDGGIIKPILTLNAAENIVEVGTTTYPSSIDVKGTITSTGTITGNVTGNLTGTASTANAVTVTAKNTENTTVYPTFVTGTGSQSLYTDSGLSYNPSTNILTTTASAAQYADLAEIYESDAEYEPGTVVIFGGDKEITQCNGGNDTRVAGVISENPAYLMNSNATGQAVALLGKVKCKVQGFIKKGDMLGTHNTLPGVAKKISSPNPGTIIGKALEDYDSAEIGAINIVVGRC